MAFRRRSFKRRSFKRRGGSSRRRGRIARRHRVGPMRIGYRM